MVQLSLILKIGGSLFSDKSRQRHIDPEAIQQFARLIAQLARHASGRLALVIGGGSFGHGAVRDADPDDPLGILGLTEANFTQKWIWARALRSEGIAAIPLQLMAMCTLDDGRLVVEHHVLRRCFATGVVPVVSGDCLLGANGALDVFGSDRVPGILAPCLPPPVRVVALTDTAGILRGSDQKHVLRHINPDAPQAAYASLWPASKHDTTGGMLGKLEAFLELARQGFDCVVMKGDMSVRSLMFLFDEPDRWPSDVSYTWISRRFLPAAAADRENTGKEGTDGT